MNRKKIVIAAGGTGGHLFPAQALADELKEREVDILFLGAGLEQNRYFNRDRYPYIDIPSGTIFKSNPLYFFQSLISLFKGIKQSLKLLRTENPDLVVGFGSFHAFPILCAARLQKTPIALFESNAFPGKVNRLFSAYSLYTAVVFAKARQYLKGSVVDVAMPVRRAAQEVSVEAARTHFGLDPQHSTILIFGGSQGAMALNELVINSMEILKSHHFWFQVIHITGRASSVEHYQKMYALANIRACVKHFEPDMPLAYQAASFAICRSGAATVSELIAFEVPSILIPFPHAADDHQEKNAKFLQQEVGGAIYHAQRGLSKEVLATEMNRFLDPQQSKISKMKKALHDYKSHQDRKELCTLIYETLNPKESITLSESEGSE